MLNDDQSGSRIVTISYAQDSMEFRLKMFKLPSQTCCHDTGGGQKYLEGSIDGHGEETVISPATDGKWQAISHHAKHTEGIV